MNLHRSMQNYFHLIIHAYVVSFVRIMVCHPFFSALMELLLSCRDLGISFEDFELAKLSLILRVVLVLTLEHIL